MNHRVLEHTADLYIEGYGKTFEEALEGLAEGMFKHMGKAKKEKESFEIGFEASDSHELIVGLFSKILSECDAEGFIPKKIKVLEYSKPNQSDRKSVTSCQERRIVPEHDRESKGFSTSQIVDAAPSEHSCVHGAPGTDIPFLPSSGVSNPQFVNGKLRVKVFGEKGLLSNVIKAVTYHLFGIEEKKGEVKIRVLFDT